MPNQTNITTEQKAAARRAYAAFPVVVSDQDTYPGQGKVDAVQTVKSTYTLIGSSSSSGSGPFMATKTPPCFKKGRHSSHSRFSRATARLVATS